jgi:hypothetical protein
MVDTSKWKDKFLSSGIPLEFEAAKVLTGKGFAIDSDYAFRRLYDGLSKDSSVDILATGYMPLIGGNNIQAELFLLIECKYRTENIHWLFLPEINSEDFSPFNLETIRLHDTFSSYTMSNDNIRKFPEQLSACYKGTEIDMNKGAVYDSEIKRGLNQLRYALPRLYCETILHNANQHPDDSVPLLFCPILLTNAKLHVLKEPTNIQTVKDSNTLEDISESANLIEVYTDYGPDFVNHCIEACKDLHDLKIVDRNKIFKRRTERKIDKYDFATPIYRAFELASGSTNFLKRYFTQFIVCNFDSFPNLLDLVIKHIREDLISLKQVIKMDQNN